MKTPIRMVVAFGCSLVLAGLATGCGGGEPTEKVDVQAQMQNLKSDNAETRQNACVELAKAGESGAPAVQALIPLLKDADPLVRRLAAYALGQIGPKAKAAIPALKELLNDTERDVVTATINAIRAIDETAAGNIAAPPNVSN
jgi:HEAT repeat protein